MSGIIKCIIIEDEPIASEIMQDYISDIQQLKLIGAFSDALYAADFLRTNEVDVIFLDLHLPKLNGFDFLKTLEHPPQVIVTTAYHQYALEGYDLNIVDYLLKPIEFTRLLKSVNKLNVKLDSKDENATINSLSEDLFSYFNVNKRNVKVYWKDICYIESLKEYVKIHLKESYIVTQFQIGEIEKKLENLDVLRIHRSFLVVHSKIDAFTSSTIEVNGNVLPIGRTYKRAVLEKINL